MTKVLRSVPGAATTGVSATGLTWQKVGASASSSKRPSMLKRYATTTSVFCYFLHDFSASSTCNFRLLQFDQLIPCHARRYVWEKMGFEDHESMETKIIQLRTHHGYDFAVKLYNSVNSSNFGCLKWEALSKAYDFHEGMLLTFDLGDPEDDMDEDNVDKDNVDEANIDIWVLVDTLPILPLCELLKHSY